MPRTQYALEPGGPKRVELDWQYFRGKMVVRFDGQTLGQFETLTQQLEGLEFSLPTGGQLRVELSPSLPNSEIRVSLDGVPLPGSVAAPETRVKNAAGTVSMVGGFTLLAALLTELFHVQAFLDLGVGWASAAAGVLYLLLGYLVRARRSAVALGLAVGGLGLEALYFVSIGVAHTKAFDRWLWMRAFLTLVMIRGFSAIKTLKNSPLPSTRAPAGDGVRNDPYEPPRS